MPARWIDGAAGAAGCTPTFTRSVLKGGKLSLPPPSPHTGVVVARCPLTPDIAMSGNDPYALPSEKGLGRDGVRKSTQAGPPWRITKLNVRLFFWLSGSVPSRTLHM